MAADGTELWARVSRVDQDFRCGRWKLVDVPLNEVDKGDIFPGAFSDSEQYWQHTQELSQDQMLYLSSFE